MGENAAPCISIVLPTYNGAAHLRESMDSCLTQTFRDLELIVVVDGSTDETEEILASYSDPRLRTFKQENRGLPSALNAGFDRARGSLWSWTSDDNVYLPEAMQVMWEYLQEHSQDPMVCADCLLMDDSGTVYAYTDQTWACFLYRAEAARLAGPYRPEFALVEDVDFFLRLQHYAGPIARIRKPYYRYRQHKTSLSSQQGARRQLASLRLHYDLVAHGIERLDLRELFFDRLSVSALYHDHESMDAMVRLARDEHLDFANRLARRRDFLLTAPGWLLNRVTFAARGLRGRFRNRALFLANSSALEKKP